jgi:hypothetical protein
LGFLMQRHVHSDISGVVSIALYKEKQLHFSCSASDYRSEGETL